MADSVNLYASNLYGEIQNRDIKRSNDSSNIQNVKAKEFHKLVESNFNDYSKLSPQEILSRINKVKSTSNIHDTVKLNFSSSAMNELKNTREILKRQERESQKASIGKANLVELLTTTTQAENSLSVIVAIRDEMKTAWDKIWGMQL